VRKDNAGSRRRKEHKEAEGEMPSRVDRFAGEHDFLSNFYPSPVELDGMEFPTVEHAFQAAKTLDSTQRHNVQAAKTPAAAKRMGRRIKCRNDWYDVSLAIMESLIRQKFARYPELRDRLIATGDAELIEGNTWNDTFYGAVWDGKKNEWVGENHLGRILMKVRDELPSG